MLDIYGVFSGSSSYGFTDFTHIGDLELDFHNQEGNSPVEISIIEEVNGKVVDEEVIKEAIANNRISIPMDKRITLEPKDKFNMYVNVKDKYGLIYKYAKKIINKLKTVNNIVKVYSVLLSFLALKLIAFTNCNTAKIIIMNTEMAL